LVVVPTVVGKEKRLEKFSEYRDAVSKFAQYPQQGNNLVYPALGLSGEAGELAEKIKKLWRNFNHMGLPALVAATALQPRSAWAKDADSLVEGIRKEMGDCLWYLDAIAREMGTTLGDIAQENAAKLESRARRGVIKGEGDNR
jgi:NTP pyrophosphatase (non-canonical NTP hydrolase)